MFGLLTKKAEVLRPAEVDLETAALAEVAAKVAAAQAAHPQAELAAAVFEVVAGKLELDQPWQFFYTRIL